MTEKLPLFTVTHWLLKAATVFCIFLVAVLTLALGAVVAGLGALLVAPSLLKLVDIPLVVESIPLDTILAAALFLVAGGLICTVFVLLAVRATNGIVQTAISGDPFVGDNAERLKRIGWLLLGVMVVQFLSTTIVAWIAPDNNIAGHIDGGSGPSLAGCLAVLLIFVLARIFRHGSEMRDELEGMV
ncbi:MAG TPA: DUF2975 domain-containing protein [Rhizomicrobium sp.]|nr:DUF2975 domain-containing protein [Rhizomicrobium sp.]